MSLARLWSAQNRSDDARRQLSDVYSWFTEGFDTPDLQAARHLLAQL
jgi:predicted ATPase